MLAGAARGGTGSKGGGGGVRLSNVDTWEFHLTIQVFSVANLFLKIYSELENDGVEMVDPKEI